MKEGCYNSDIGEQNSLRSVYMNQNNFLTIEKMQLPQPDEDACNLSVACQITARKTESKSGRRTLGLNSGGVLAAARSASACHH